jgi:ABC-type multidrug transport system ATPase subunit
VVADRPASVGYVPDRFPPHDRMSAQSYLAHMGRIRGMGSGAARARAVELLDRLSLVGGAATPLRQLSRGNAQKVALAQALLLRPDLLVLDEPWSGLDASAHGALGEILADVRAGGGCVVFTDQREAVAATHATRIERIDGGRLTEEPVTDVVEAARIELRALAGTAALGEQPGVLGTWERAGVTVVAVAGDHCDELLRTALAGGWSVLSVRRAVLPTAGAPL